MKTRIPYPTDLNDKQWQILQPLIPEAKSGGRPVTYPKREILNGIFPAHGCRKSTIVQLILYDMGI
jgi:transposase